MAQDLAQNRRTQLPKGSLEWMVEGQQQKILCLGSGKMPQILASRGHQVFVVTDSADQANALAQAGITATVAKAESLPFHPCQFDVVVIHQCFHEYAPGVVLSEITRVLRPGGQVSVSYMVRDDTVPWVNRLATLMQSVNPEAMAEDAGIHSVEYLLSSKYFPNANFKSFRVWVPITRSQMLNMATEATSGAEESAQQRLLGGVASLYDEYSTGIGQLKLPYQLKCWKAWVDHSELTAPIEIDDSGLVIPI